VTFKFRYLPIYSGYMSYFTRVIKRVQHEVVQSVAHDYENENGWIITSSPPIRLQVWCLDTEGKLDHIRKS
jgi:hypothetical protein